jgi:hypothetical protein
MTQDQMKSAAASLATELRQHPGNGDPTGGSKHRGLPDPVRERFIALRAAMYARGIYDPVLVRFDSATAPQASNEELAAQLETLTQSL